MLRIIPFIKKFVWHGQFFFFQLQRNILGSQPRVTKFKIDWDDARDSENIPPSENVAENASSSSQSAMDQQKSVPMLDNSNSACAMEVA